MGIQVNAIAPGFTKTGITADLRQGQDSYAKVSRSGAIKDWGKSAEIPRAAFSMLARFGFYELANDCGRWRVSS